MSEDHTPKPPPEPSRSGETTGGESSSQPHGRICQAVRKIKKSVIKKVSKLKRSRNHTPAVQSINLEVASPSQNIEDASHLPPSDGDKPTASANPSGCVNQGTSGESAPKVLNAGLEGIPDPQLVGAELRVAHEASGHMKLLGGRATSAVSTTQSTQTGLATVDDVQTTYLQPLKLFDTAIGKIADVHPYAKMALGVLSAASKIILAQAKRDQSMQRLLKKLDEVYRFMSQDDTLGQISSKHGIVGRIAQQTLECARFIRDYSETKSFWKRLGKNAVSETNAIITQYNDALEGLMQQFRDQAIRDVADLVQCTGETLDLSGMAYAAGAGLDTMKQCSPGTRTAILSQITEWINDSGDAAPRVLWLSGPAGKGKSAIAHTIANWFNDMGGLGSCFCFDRNNQADKRHEKVFSTIARDLADRDPEMRRALANTVKNANALKHTTDIVQQWRKLLMEPLKKSSVSTVGPVLIVIEALDESGGVETRRNLLRILAGKLQVQGLPQITELPSNFRILVTSRPLHDINEELEGPQHILRLSMDNIPQDVVKRDIASYVSEELTGLSDFQDKEFAVLAAKADGLFEWARLACEHIKASPPGTHKMRRFDAVVNRGDGDRKNLLYDMYRLILTEVMNRDQYNVEEYQEALAGFRSVMGQILGTAESLPFASLNAMRNHFPERSKRDNMDIVKHMGALLSGTTNSYTPIRPLHASFHEFLTDKSHSGDFFVEVSKVQCDLAFASLRVMEHYLRFNICDLKSSYIPNCEDTELPQRVETYITPHLSYSCRFWATHVQATDFDTELAKEIKSFFDNERLLFYIEVLGLLSALSSAVYVFPFISRWLKGQSEYGDLLSTAMDVQRFVQVFGGMILHSTPHLYVSALPFSPSKSTVATSFACRFPNTLRLIHRRHVNWTAIQTVISGHTGWVLSVSFSPDGTRIVSGSKDHTVRLWDAATGQPLGEPLRGHAGSVSSVSFSPDGTRIVSGSKDHTVRLWDAATGQPLGKPLRGHTDSVLSVSFSPDGTRIVSGSWDHTVRLWDAATGQPLGEPLRGHTDSVKSVSFSPDGTRIVSGSWDHTVRLWDAVAGQPFQEYTETNSSPFSLDRHRTTPCAQDTIMPTNTWDNPAICFASSLEHALRNPAELLKNPSHHHSESYSNSNSFFLGNDGWMAGPHRRLLFWVPPASRQPPFITHIPGTVLVIGGEQEIDLSRMAHGQHWSNCRDAPPQ